MIPSSTGILLGFVMGYIHSRWIIGISVFSISIISSSDFTSSRSSRIFLVSASRRLTVASNDFYDERKRGNKIIQVQSIAGIIMQSKKCFAEAKAKKGIM